jgi:homopolymeric O-antigen transport system ATP-binding protein
MSSDERFALKVEGVGKCYHMYRRPSDRLKQIAFRGKKQLFREFWALRNISFQVEKGESFAIVGRNGSGKSTLLQIIAGTLAPTAGSAIVRGRVGALLELGSGFSPEFTGRENVYMNGAILGMTRRDVDQRFDAIAGFADIGQFIDRPVKTYSSGMLVRLAFSVQVQLEPDILIVDEALAVGDNLFQKRCFQRLGQMREAGVTLLFVSHAQEAVRTLTTRALLLDEGEMRSIGESGEVLLDYRRLLHDAESRWHSGQIKAYAEEVKSTERSNGKESGLKPAESDTAADDQSFGDFDAQIMSVEVLDGEGEGSSVFEPGDPMRFRLAVRANRDITHLNVALRLRDKQGVKMYSWGTLNQDIAIRAGKAQGEIFWDRRLAQGEIVTVEFVCDCTLGVNFYEVQAAVSEEATPDYENQRMLHWKDEVAFFQVTMTRDEYFFGGVTDLRMEAHVTD